MRLTMTLLIAAMLSSWCHGMERKDAVLTTATLKAYVEQFNADDEELYSNIKNKDALAFL